MGIGEERREGMGIGEERREGMGIGEERREGMGIGEERRRHKKAKGRKGGGEDMRGGKGQNVQL